MRKLLAIALLLALSAAGSGARQQQQQQAGGGARLVEKFGEIQWSDMMARLDNYAIELQNEPAARGLVVAYATPHKFPGWPLRRAGDAREYLAETRGLDASRVSVVNGGLRDETAFELWVVPAGAEPPVNSFDVSLLMAGVRSAVVFDRLAVIERGDHPGVEHYFATPHVGDAGLYAYFAEVLRRDPGLRGYVIGYAAKRGNLAAARRLAVRAKLTIARSHAVDLPRVVAVGGGRREHKMVELWLVPPGAEPPKPTPASGPARRPVRRQRRSA